MELYVNLVAFSAFLLNFRTDSVYSVEDYIIPLPWLTETGVCYDENRVNVPCGQGGSIGKTTAVKDSTNPCKPPASTCKRHFHFEKMRKVDFYTAKKECTDMGMQLVSIQSPEKWEEVAKAIESAGRSFYWTSAANDLKERHFAWGNGCPFSFTNWDTTQPDNLFKDENCVIIWDNMRWHDFPCVSTFKNAYICESIECRN